MQSISSLFVFCALAIAAQACTPSFEGAGVFVKDGAGQFLSPGGFQVPQWHVQQDGQADPGFIFRDFNNNNLALTRNADNSVTEAPASNSGNDPRQDWHIQCDTCQPGAANAPAGTVIASGCRIQATDPNGSFCLAPGGDGLLVAGCGRVGSLAVFTFTK